MTTTYDPRETFDLTRPWVNTAVASLRDSNFHGAQIAIQAINDVIDAHEVATNEVAAEYAPGGMVYCPCTSVAHHLVLMKAGACFGPVLPELKSRAELDPYYDRIRAEMADTGLSWDKL